jgi:hypothetical protein
MNNKVIRPNKGDMKKLYDAIEPDVKYSRDRVDKICRELGLKSSAANNLTQKFRGFMVESVSKPGFLYRNDSSILQIQPLPTEHSKDMVSQFSQAFEEKLSLFQKLTEECNSLKSELEDIQVKLSKKASEKIELERVLAPVFAMLSRGR